MHPIAPWRVRAAGLAVACTAALALFAGGAQAAPVSIGGNPMTVYIDQLGQCQSTYVIAGTEQGNVYPGSNKTGDCGFFISAPGIAQQPASLQHGGSGYVFGFNGNAGPSGLTEYQPVHQGSVSGSGTAADPYTLVTVYDVVDPTAADPTTAQPLLQITQTTTYVTGNAYFTAYYDVQNVSSQSIYFQSIYADDLYVNGDDQGTGVFLAGPPRFVGGQNASSGVLGGIQEVLSYLDGSPVPAWTTYAEDYWDQIDNGAGGLEGIWYWLEHSAGTGSPFPNAVNPTFFDNGVGVSWDNYYAPSSGGLAPGAHARYAAINRTAIPSSLVVNPTSQAHVVGQTATIQVTARDSSGDPYSNRPLRYTITGNNAAGMATVNTDANGVATIAYVGHNAGVDLVNFFLDLAGNSTQDANDPSGSAQVQWVPAPPPPAAHTTGPITPPSPNSTVIVKSVTVNPNGTITITYVPNDPGQGVLTVTVPSASVASHGLTAEIARRKSKRCARGKVLVKRKCVPPNTTVGVARGSGTPGVPLTLSVKPTGKILAALHKGKTLRVIATLVYQSARGGAPSKYTFHLTLKGHKTKHKKH